MTITATIPIVRLNGISKKFTLHKDKSLKDRALYFTSRAKSKSEFEALHDVSFDINLGQTVGLLGHNGSGKSTLLKVIGGIIDPSGGTVERRGRIAALLELGAGFHPDLSGRENVYLNAAILGMSKQETDEVFEEIVEFSGIGEFIDSQVKFYSSGMYVRLAFAVAVHSDPDLLLVDEVLAVGDEPFQAKCMNKIREFQREGRTIVLVSHSADQVADVCDRAVVLDAGRVVYDGAVGEGIRVLREGYERDRVEAEQESAQRHNEPVEQPVCIDRVTVTDGSNQEIHGIIEPGTDLTITIHATLTAPVEWVTGFTIATPIGQNVYRLNTEGLGIELPAEVGSYAVAFTLPHSNFSAGRLVLSVGAIGPKGIYTMIDPIGMLDFADDPAGVGYMQFDARGSVVVTS
ncbi:polysaccharide ABC transporter ATP-binding protein [Agromyces badenianii]|uniref:ABC transporter ATP-binding protein n=1 Tax=Agromyces badenianii TaxID=2080742 RepID=UPI000D58E6DA|nr:polysaccharide ABC transporter ATP-binding protein [Agromyces badenianii]PWC03801.1 ABC transporter ATP-binding protein [Agromyces badenianii]